MPKVKKTRQMSMCFDPVGRGGRRVGAGRKRTSRNVAHGKRRGFASTRPLHVTLRIGRDVRGLRRRLYAALYRVFCETCDQGRFRLIHYSVMRTHVHLIVEARDRAAMSRGMQRVGKRLAWRVNRVLGRRGQVICDRYHEEHLETPRQVRNALASHDPTQVARCSWM
jgi:REP element-mobilizing transposase RayT